ncbi:hypothetical protein [Rivularia sp. UHCC 0363]|uniref:hypothetical protein n=1 Tax=Rivularia sp. UHCC 0363 TaxID=3110244 RepID=UPI002B20FC30|nr:hypothetical protein [Rivularia sp. UHCC 0363]MEA5595758.1 hypothetical protein [Rivularia sp. UHCC 0363]
MTKKPKGWYKQIVLRPVVHVDGYASYEKVCSYVANSYFSRLTINFFTTNINNAVPS